MPIPHTPIFSKLSGYAITAGSASAGKAPLTVEPLPNPEPNPLPANQIWGLAIDPNASWAFVMINPDLNVIEIPTFTFADDGDPVAAVPLAISPNQLWYLFADTQESNDQYGNPYCFLMSYLCIFTSDANPVRAPGYTKTLDVKGDSDKAGATVQAFPINNSAYFSTPTSDFDNQLWSPGKQGWPFLPWSLPPSTGLQGNSNYFLGNYVIDVLKSLKVTIVVEEDLVCDKGVSFQLNGFGAQGAGEVWQQYCVLLAPGSSSLNCLINNWTINEYNSWAGGGPGQLPIVYDETQICPLPHPYIPKETTITIELQFDSRTSVVNQVAFKVAGPNGEFAGAQTIDVTQTPAIPSSLLDCQLLVVGYANGAHTTFIVGSGTITYETPDMFEVAPSLGFEDAWDSGALPALIPGGSGEDSNMNYTFLPPSNVLPSTKLIQTFKLSGH